MNVIDTHLHLDEAVEGDASAAVDALAQALDAADIQRGVLLQLNMQRWPQADVGAAVNRHKNLIAFANVHPFDSDCNAQLSRAIEVHGYSGLKLHPRLQAYPVNHPKTQGLVQHAGTLGVPVIADAFPDGEWLLQGQSMLDFGRLARACPDTNIVAAHIGGHEVLQLTMVAKRCPNLFVDVSFSLLYYRGSSVPADICYALRSLRFKKVFYGSDYPDRGLTETLDSSVTLLREHGVSKENLQALLHDNADEFFSW